MLGDPEAHVATTDLESDYEILGELGRGATAVVYRARDRELGREVAIKVIRPKYADDDETVARLAREARTVAQLQHPNIVTLYAVRRLRDGGIALVMQLVPGRTLRDMLNDRGAFTFERADRVLRDVGAALAHAHHRSIVHRDVKPENIFIDESTGHALLSDFGVARSLEPDSQLTATGTAIGTPSYMSPEQIDGTELDGRSDLYSLGLVGWEMLTGRRPWEGEGLYSVIFKQKKEELQPIDEIRPDTPDRLIYLIEGCIRKNPTERWNGAGDLLEHASTISPEGGWSRWHSERRKRRRSVVYSAARERGDSVVSAALETMRFRRDGSMPIPRPPTAPDGLPVPGPVDRSGARTQADARRAVAPVPAPEKRKRSVAPLLVGGLLVVAVIGATARVMRGRVDPDARTQAQTTFADNGGVEVPVTRNPAPNVAAPASPQVPAASARLAEKTRPQPAAPLERVTPPVSRAPKTNPSSGDVSSSSTSTAPAPALPTAFPSRDSAPTVVVPAPVVPNSVAFPAERAIVAAGGRHSCSLGDGGAAVCWGANDQGQLGDGSREDHPGPSVVAGNLAFSQLSAGASHTCGVTRDGDTYCWGNNERGQLGDATSLQRDTPVRVGAAGPFRTVRAGLSHSCALARSGDISCWGSNAYGQLGSGVGLTSSRPVAVAGDLRFGAMAVGWNHTCGITTTGEVYCWGSNNAGQLGDGTRDDRRLPVRAATTVRFIALAAGTQHTCAVATAGDVYCWGRNNYGQLGSGAGDHSQPTRVDADGDFSTVTAGAVHSCARTTGGQVFCWGGNTFGQLGDGTTTNRSAPVRVAALPGVVVVQASGAHTCAATSGGESYCWGYNVEGQLGDGTRDHRSRPVRVSAPSK